MLDTTSTNLDCLTLQATTIQYSRRENTETPKFRTIASTGIKLKVAKPGDYVGISISRIYIGQVRRGQVVFAPPLNFTGKSADYHFAVRPLIVRFLLFLSFSLSLSLSLSLSSRSSSSPSHFPTPVIL